MTQEEKEFLFIEALALALNCSKGEIIEAFNSGNIYIFDLEGIHQYYSEIIDYPPRAEETTKEIQEDIKNKELIKLDSNTFAMWA
tara:strand:- start:165 stop:419 length:255 start_codon:yes stop_codon:yes gene_type:complete